MVLFSAVCLAIIGLYSFHALNIEAYPDPAPPLLEAITQNTNWSAEEMEKQVTIPVEQALSGMPNLEHMRSISLFGLSDVKCYFSYDSNYDTDRQEFINRLGMATLPPGLSPSLSPESTIGELYRFVMRGKGYTLRDFKEWADWTCVRYFKTVPGVVDVATFGGPTKQFHVDLDPNQLVNYKISVPQVMTALANGNANAGGNYFDIGSQGYNVRGLGLFKNLRDIEEVVVAERNGVPIYVRQLGRVGLGRAIPLGRVGRDGVEDIVEGIVLMRVGAQSQPTVDGIKRMADRLNKEVLPKGMSVEPYYDRSDLIAVTSNTVEHTLFSGMILVTLVLIAFIGNFRAALIVAITIPLSLAVVFIVMVMRGDSANLISMGAIDFGIIADASVIMVENIHRNLTLRNQPLTSVRLIASEAARQVVTPVFFATFSLFVCFLPLFTMRGMEGKIFGPMAQTYGLALLGSLMLAYTLSPVLSSLLLKKEEGHDTPIMRVLRRPYGRFIRTCVRRYWVVAALTTVALGGTLAIIPAVGGEFMPKLEEGNLWVRATLPLSVSYSIGSTVANKVRDVFDSYPEVTTVVSQYGRPDDGTDTAGYFNIEFFVSLSPRDTWPGHISKEELVRQMNDRLHQVVPNATFNFSQNIEDNVEEALSGVKGMNSVKIFGPDLAVLDDLANRIERIMKGVDGVTDLGVFHELGQPDLLISTDREAAARYGLQIADVNGMVNAAIGGTAATQVLDGDRRFDVVVRLLAPYRKTVEAIKRAPVVSPDGEPIPLGAVANIESKIGAGYIYREDNSRYIPVKFSVRGRDLASTVAEADEKIRQQVKLPPTYFIQWSGEVEQLGAAMKRLRIIVPVTLMIVIFLLWKTFNSMADALLILFTVPLASIGGVWSLYFREMPFSISAAVGFISIVGVCLLEGVLLVSRIKAALADGIGVFESVIIGAEQRLRPVLMVACTAAFGLLPAALSTGIGSETQKPLATVVVVGVLTSGLVNLIVHPALFYMVHIHTHERRGWSWFNPTHAARPRPLPPHADEEERTDEID